MSDITVTDLIKSRRTIRKFQQKAIDVSLLRQFTDAARLAPSGANLQPLKYIIVESRNMTDRLFEHVKWAGYLAPHYNPKEDERPTAYIVVCADKTIRENGCDMDVGAAAENIILSALSHGVGCCWMASIDRDKIRGLLNVCDNLEISCVLALGYPKEEPKEVEYKGDVKYYLDGKTLCVPKRSMEEVLVDIF